MKKNWLVCSLALLIGASACSGDKASGTGHPSGNTEDAATTSPEAGTKPDMKPGKPEAGTKPGSADMVSVKISADKGGTVAIGSAGLDIPGGSLPGDVEVTVEAVAPPSSLPDTKSLTGKLYDFGPDGTKFDPPATLTLPVETAPGSGQTAVVSWLDEKSNTWVDLETTITAGKASAPIAHFTKFILRLKDAGAGPVDCSYTECGGDLTGTWSITAACIDDHKDAGSSNPFGPACPDAVYDVAVDATGIVTFGSDKSFDIKLMASPAITIKIPGACLTNGALPFADCGTLAKALDKDGGVACTANTSTGCDCTGQGGTGTSQHKTGTYAVDGNTFTTTEDLDSGGTKTGDPTSFCVSGNSLKVKSNDGTIINAVRK